MQKTGNITKMTALVFLCCLLCCCRQDVRVQSKQIDFGLFDTLETIRQGEILDRSVFTSEDRTKPFRLIHFDGASLCSSCLLKQYYLWDELISHLGDTEVDYFFVLEPREDFTTEQLAASLNTAYFSRPVFIDRAGDFRRTHCVISQSGSVDILTNHEGTVLFVGDLRSDANDYFRIQRNIRKISVH